MNAEQFISDIGANSTTQCMLNSDLCRNIASYCDGVDLLQLERVNSHWKHIATCQFYLLIELRDYKNLTLHRRHALSSIKRACFQISSRRNKNDGVLNLFGGAYDSSSRAMCSLSDSCDLFSTVSVAAKINQDLPRSLSCGACTTDNDGNILVLGGWDDLISNTVATVRSFNTQNATRTWTSLAPLCRPRCFGGAIALSTGDLLHIGGGSSLYVGGVCFADTFIRKASTRSWQEKIVPNVLQARYGHSVVELFNGDVVMIGGYAGGSNFHNSVEMLTRSLDRWISLPSMSVPRSAMATVLGPDGCVYVAGGTLDGTQGHKSLERYDPREGKWTRLADMHVHRGCTTGCLSVCKSGFYAFGGMHNWKYNSNIEFYDFRMDQWTLMESSSTEGNILLNRAIPHVKLDI